MGNGENARRGACVDRAFTRCECRVLCVHFCMRLRASLYIMYEILSNLLANEQSALFSIARDGTFLVSVRSADTLAVRRSLFYSCLLFYTGGLWKTFCALSLCAIVVGRERASLCLCVVTPNKKLRFHFMRKIKLPIHFR